VIPLNWDLVVNVCTRDGFSPGRKNIRDCHSAPTVFLFLTQIRKSTDPASVLSLNPQGVWVEIRICVFCFFSTSGGNVPPGLSEPVVAQTLEG